MQKEKKKKKSKENLVNFIAANIDFQVKRSKAEIRSQKWLATLNVPQVS